MRLHKTLPMVGSRTNTLTQWEGNSRLPDITLDSPEWFAWLEKRLAFRMVYFPASGAEEFSFNVRPETRPHGGVYWQGWKSIKGRRVKKYIGPSSKLSHKMLIATGEWFHQQMVANESVDQQLVKTIRGLVLIVEDLLPYCADPALTEQAQEHVTKARKAIKPRTPRKKKK